MFFISVYSCTLFVSQCELKYVQRLDKYKIKAFKFVSHISDHVIYSKCLILANSNDEMN